MAGKPWYASGGLLYKVVIPMITSPMLGLVCGFLGMTLLYLTLSPCKPSSVNAVFRKLQIFSVSRFLEVSSGLL